MKVIVQRVNSSSCLVSGKVISEIKKGYLLLVGIGKDDDEKDLIKVADKISKLRIFSDENGKMNKSIKDVEGSILSISQFTLFADVKKGNRPSFINAKNADEAKRMYLLFNDLLREKGHKVFEGIFQEDMIINIENDGPVTIIVNSEELK